MTSSLPIFVSMDSLVCSANANTWSLKVHVEGIISSPRTRS